MPGTAPASTTTHESPGDFGPLCVESEGQCDLTVSEAMRRAPRQDAEGHLQEPQVIVHAPCVLQKVVFTGEGEHVVEPVACGLSVETPGHQFQ